MIQNRTTDAHVRHAVAMGEPPVSGPDSNSQRMYGEVALRSTQQHVRRSGMEGKIVGSFRIGDLYRSGQLSSVHVAEERLAGGGSRQAAVKLIASPNPDEPGFVEAFVQDALLQARFAELEGVLKVYAAEQKFGTLAWVGMELAHNSLDRMISDHPTPPAQVERMLRDTLAGLQLLHEYEWTPVLHRNIKPSNILLVRRGQEPRFVLTDVKARHDELPAMPSSAALARYLAPEFCENDPRHESPASDLYSLGVVAYHMLLGTRAFEDATVGEFTSGAAANAGTWMQWHCSRELVAAPAHRLTNGIPTRLAETIARMMAKSVDQRFASAADVLRSLSGETRSTLVLHDKAAVDAPVRPSRRDSRWPLVIGGAAALVGVLGACAWTLAKPTPVLTVDASSCLEGYGMTKQIVVRASGLPDGATVEFAAPGHPAVPLEGEFATPGLFSVDVNVKQPRRVRGEVVARRADRSVLTRVPLELERLQPIEVTVQLTPAVEGTRLDVTSTDAGAGQVRVTATTDRDGRARVRLEPGGFSLRAECDQFEVEERSRAWELSPESDEATWNVRLVSLEGVVEVEGVPPTARVTVTSGTESRIVPISGGRGELRLRAGGWKVTAEAEGWVAGEQTVVIPKGGRQHVIFSLREVPKPPPPAPVAAPVPEDPPTGEAIAMSVRETVPLEQVRITSVTSTDSVLVSGVVFSEAERLLLEGRLKAFQGRVTNEVQVDAECVADRIRKELRSLGIQLSKGQVLVEDGRLFFKFRDQPLTEAARNSCQGGKPTMEELLRSVSSRYLLCPEKVTIRVYAS